MDRQFQTFRVNEAANGAAPREAYHGNDGVEALEVFKAALDRDAWVIELQGWGGATAGWKMMRLYKRYR